MKKRICIFFLLTVFSVGFLSAKVKLTLDVGPVYTYFSSRTTINSESKIQWATHTGGLNVLFGAEFVQNFGVYVNANFAFGQKIIDVTKTGNNRSKTITIARWNGDLTYVIDSQFGFFYVFHPIKKLDLTLGAGIGIGGSGRNYTKTELGVTKKEAISQANIGGGINFTASYMFTKMVGIYGGVSQTFYAPVSTTHRTKVGNETTETTNSSASGKFAHSFNIKAGIQLFF